MKTRRINVAATAFFFAILAGILGGCGGGPAAEYASTAGIESQQARVEWSITSHAGIGLDGRSDYKQAMYDECVKQNGSSGCSRPGRGWFVPWSQTPTVAIPTSSSPEEAAVIRRAIAVMNRSLVSHIQLEAVATDATFTGVTYEDAGNHRDRLVQPGTIHAEVYDYPVPQEGLSGFGGTDGNRAFAFARAGRYDFSSRDGRNPGWDMRAAVGTMVHEFVHALGLVGHPHPIHTSVLSYRYHRKGELDNLPLVDVSVLYDMYNLAHWSTELKGIVDTADGVQFGMRSFNYGTISIPWVDAGYMPPPEPAALSGRASYRGDLVGMTALGAVYGDADLSVNFGNGSGQARFHQIKRNSDNTMWNRRGWNYKLDLYAHYFDSRTDPRDQDGIPDVVGAFYGWDAEVAAGTLQRPEITAAFGAEKN